MAREENDFSWSSWADTEMATSEIDEIAERIELGEFPSAATVVFLPTGPMQELAISSGWGDEFLRLSDWFDEACAGRDCECYQKPLRVGGNALGMDLHYGESYLRPCPECGKLWLEYFYELEAYSKTGRWFVGALPRGVRDVAPEHAKQVLENLPWYFFGGSYFDGKVDIGSGAVPVP